MCITVFITQFCERFPFILINNRDELLDRFTYPLALDAASGIVWAVDGVAGGSWLGIEGRSGRLATVTNCRRPPSSPLMREAVSLEGWRGAAPLEEVLKYTVVRSAPSLDGTEKKTLSYEPLTSRGTIIKDYLLNGTLPGSEYKDDTVLPPSLHPPFYAGYNLLSCDTLFTEDTPVVHYTSNRFHAPYRQELKKGEIHCLQNSFIDNWIEPKSRLLRQRFDEQLKECFTAGGAFAEGSVKEIASQLAQHCLCAQPNFDLIQQLSELEAKVAQCEVAEEKQRLDKELQSLRKLLHSTNPFWGLTERELQHHFQLSPSDYLDSFDYQKISHDVLKEAYFQRNIFVPAQSNYGTQMQSVVLLERTPSGPVAHFLQRAVDNKEGEPVSFQEWVHYPISKENDRTIA